MVTTAVALCNYGYDCCCTVVDPALVLEVNPITQTVLDVASYNVVSVVCNVTQPQEVNISKRISWDQTSPSGTMLTLNHDGININITDIDLDNSASASVLSLYATLAGRWSYACDSSIQIQGNPIISYSQSAEVIVKGNVYMHAMPIIVFSLNLYRCLYSCGTN